MLYGVYERRLAHDLDRANVPRHVGPVEVMGQAPLIDAIEHVAQAHLVPPPTRSSPLSVGR